MIIRALNTKDGLQVYAYANARGKQRPLAVLTYDRTVADITVDELRADMSELREQAMQKYAEVVGLQRYMSNGGD